MTKTALIPIYSTRGEAEAFLQYPYLFNRSGEWIGFVTPKREVYSVLGDYAGMLTDDPRIISKRDTSSFRSKLQPPPAPPKVQLPATTPLAPMMPELGPSMIDVLMEAPERLHTLDTGENRQDMD